MKKSLLGIALCALMTAGMAQANTTTTPPTATDGGRFAMSCTFGSVGCSAEARIVLSGQEAAAAENGVVPQWFGTLLAVSCRGELISASDAILYRITGDHHFNWRLDNSDATVSIFMKDHPFHDDTTTVDAALRIGDGFSPGTCTVDRIHH